MDNNANFRTFDNYFIILCPHKLQRVYKITVGREEKNLSLYRIIQVYEVINESSSGELKFFTFKQTHDSMTDQ